MDQGVLRRRAQEHPDQVSAALILLEAMVDGHTVVVGAGSGMGAAVARRLQGPHPMIVADIDEAAAARTAAQLEGDVAVVRCDVTDQASCDALASRVASLAALVVTAGLSPTMADGAKILDANLCGTARLLQAVDAAVGEGTVAVLFASSAAHGYTLPPEVLAALDDPLAPDLVGRLQAAGFDPTVPELAYPLSKHGVVRLAQRSAESWWVRGARIMSLSPGIIETPMGDREFERQPVMADMVKKVGRMGTADEVAAVTAFLVSADASFMTGSDVLVDGGVVAMANPM
jgi:NAD(P)-dependent dehydrogenase (short-subunit alcohol dehydrogenase family)